MNVSKRTWFGILALGLAIACLSPGVRAEDKKEGGSATGTWKSSIKGPDGNNIEITYKLKQEGEKLTGTVKRGEGESKKIEKGKVKDGKVSFQYAVERDGNKFTVKYQGELRGDTIKGKVEFGERSRDWEATRQKPASKKG
ncbi:MAG: hypothetical protein ACYC3I_05655 [Gemmataceae bacterium]